MVVASSAYLGHLKTVEGDLINVLVLQGLDTNNQITLIYANDFRDADPRYSISHT